MNTNNVVWHNHHLTQKARSSIKQQRPCVLWLTGLSGSGKSTIANALESKLYELGKHTYLLDGDNVRHGLNKDLGFDESSRIENIRRIGEMSKLFVDAGLIVIAAFISPFFKERQMARNLVGAGEFIEIFIDTPIGLCEERDSKGLYRKARAGEIPNFTGITSPYEVSEKTDIHIQTNQLSIEESVETIIGYLNQRGYFDA